VGAPYADALRRALFLYSSTFCPPARRASAGLIDLAHPDRLFPLRPDLTLRLVYPLQFRGHICFESLCDIQATLPWKDTAAIREEANLLLQEWVTPKGGFILSDYGDGQAIGVPIDKKQIMLDAFLAADRWKKSKA